MPTSTWECVGGASSSRDGAPPGVTVADVLRLPDRPALRCPASVLVAGELAARGVPVALGPVSARHIRRQTFVSQVPLVVSAELGDGIGLGVAVTRAWLPEVRDLLGRWANVAAERTVLLAAPRSFCAGVQRAIKAVEQALEQRGGPVYVRKQIVHNTHVVSRLAAKGAVFVDELDQVPADATVVFSAHGVSPAVRKEASRRGLEVIDTTCPLVAKVHAEARRFAGRGDTVVLIGHVGHDEVNGIVGEAPESTHVVANKADISALEVPDPTRVSYLTQTTLAEDETTDLVNELRSRFPRLRGPAAGDICYAATNRQRALTAVAASADLVLVIGSANSCNSTRLAELARRCGPPAHLIDSAADIRADWLAGVSTIGLTAGASAPPGLVATVLDAIAGLGSVRVIEQESARETIQFAPPLAVRSR